MYRFRKLSPQQYLEGFCGPVAVKYSLNTRKHLSTIIDYVRHVQVTVDGKEDILKVGTLDSTLDFIASLVGLSVIHEFDPDTNSHDHCNYKLKEMADQGYLYAWVKVACLGYNHVFAINKGAIRDICDWQAYDGSALKIWACKDEPNLDILTEHIDKFQKSPKR